MSQQIVEAVKSTINSIASGRVYYIERPQNQSQTFPYVVFTFVHTNAGKRMGDGTFVDGMIQCDLYGKRSAGAEALGDINDSLIALLNGTTASATGFDRVTFTPVDLGFASMEEDAIRITSQWRVQAFDS